MIRKIVKRMITFPLAVALVLVGPPVILLAWALDDNNLSIAEIAKDYYCSFVPDIAGWKK